MASDAGITPRDILDERDGCGPTNPSIEETRADSSSEEARAVCTRFVAEFVDDTRIASSSQIHAAVDAPDEMRVQAIGRALGCRMAGVTPEGFLADVEISKWRDSNPTKWQFERVSGAADPSIPARPQRKIDLVRAIETVTDIDGPTTVDEETGGSPRIRICVGWMRDALVAVIDAVDADVDDDLEIEELTKLECSGVLERVVSDEVSGFPGDWSKPTIAGLYDILVAGRDPAEVEL
ncbi:hypothetical protein ACFPM1_07950 [Halorubrum rubrum]|uniref:Uncharacterized protein n=1 Tax=Halorubrum rubrum TaxID=1126240 RepID=A0ABD5R1G9_9EURY|nr:hypothetical protein [Halorubrum rubrum]